MSTDLEIAQSARLLPITEIAADIGLHPSDIIPYGYDKAKVRSTGGASPAAGAEATAASASDGATVPDGGRLILVTAMSPTPAGEGKTTTSIGLADGINLLAKEDAWDVPAGQRAAVLALREPSLGPVFGMKGGAAGGGYAQVLPMEDINLHFTGDFNAIALANNLAAAVLDNHIHHGNALGIDPRRIEIRRVVDLNDRALRNTTIGLGGVTGGIPREDHFDIVVASEVMAVFCLATSLSDLRKRLSKMVVARTYDRRPVTAGDLGVAGAMTALLKNALDPNLVQTIEATPAFVHGGPFANIAHGCNSLLATRAALSHGMYAVTEAGFGSDLGAEKFLDIKCRQSGLWPAAAVVVATVRALKFHGGVVQADLGSENLEALRGGMPNLLRHLDNLRNVFGLPVVVSINRFPTDTDAEVAAVVAELSREGVVGVEATHWAEGGKGALGLARAVVKAAGSGAGHATFAYDLEQPLPDKIRAVASQIYGAAVVEIPAAVGRKLAQFSEDGYGGLPVCIAKTQYSFSTDPQSLGAPVGHTVTVRDVRLSAGAGFVVAVCGDIMTMPGLSAEPAALRIDVNERGEIVGLF